jgi:hypothetical protein
MTVQSSFEQVNFDAFNGNKNTPKYGTQGKSFSLKISCYLLAEVFMNLNRIFCSIYCILAALRIAQIGW